MPEKIRYWNKQVKSYLDSGLNQRQFCEVNNLNFNRFKYFYRKLHLNKKVAPVQPIVNSAETVVPPYSCRAGTRRRYEQSGDINRL